MNLKGWFRGLDTSIDSAGTLYRVDIITDTYNSAYTEVKLAGESPFTVSYTENETPFEPLRTSVATIKIVVESIPEVFSFLAQGVQVKLFNETANVCEWVGYLKPNLYSQKIIEQYDTIELEASDCLCSLQYYDYSVYTGGSKHIITIKNLLDSICNRCGILNGYYISKTKLVEGNGIESEINNMKISEGNFFSSDVNKPWNFQEVLTELSKYLGYTALQWRDSLYFIDNAYWGGYNTLPLAFFSKSNGYSGYTSSSLSTTAAITVEKLRGSGTDISFDTIYNKVTVNDSLYEADLLIPELFNDDNLVNRAGAFNTYEEIPYARSIVDGGSRPVYVSDRGKQVWDADDNDKQYFRRKFDNIYWDSVYYTSGGTPVTLTDEQKASSACTRNYIGATIVDFASVEKPEEKKYMPTEVVGSVSFDRYLCINQMDHPHGHYGLQPGISDYYLDEFLNVMELKSGYTNPIITDGGNSFIVLDCSALWERYWYHDYINPDWDDESAGVGFLTGAEIFGEYQTAGANPMLFFMLKIGDKYWNGKNWTTTRGGFTPPNEADTSYDNWNKEFKIMNNVSWQQEAGVTGYKIPIDNTVDLNQEIKFEIHLPSRLSDYWCSNGHAIWATDKLNGYCWIKNFSLKIVNAGTESFDEQDVIYENIIESGSTNELDEIDLKINTWPNEGPLSFSYVGYGKTFLSGIKDLSLESGSQKPELNIVEKYVSQFSTSTKKLGFTTDLSYTPLQKTSEGIYNGNYVILGQEINYAANSQDLILMQIKNLRQGDLSDNLELNRDSNELIPATGGTAILKVISNKPWTATCNADFCTISPTRNTGGGITQQITCTFTANNSYDTMRSAVVSVTNGENTEAIGIFQRYIDDTITIHRYDGIVLDKITEIYAFYTTGSTEVYVDSNSPVTAVPSDSWLTTTALGGNKFRISYAANSGAERYGYITFTNASQIKKLDVTQSNNRAITVYINEPRATVAATGGTINISIVTPDNHWTATVSTPEYGSFITSTGDNNAPLAFVMNENTSNIRRGVYFIISNGLGNAINTEFIYQDGADTDFAYWSWWDNPTWLNPNANPRIKVSEITGSTDAYVHANTDWIVPVASVQGITYEPTSGTSGITEVTITVEQGTTISQAMTVPIYSPSSMLSPMTHSNLLILDTD